jgi:hypothetical protein
MAVKSIWAQGAANGTLAASMAKRRQAFTPWEPNASPPAGTYDPGLDAQSGAIDRGQLYSTQDLETAGSRAEQDYGVQQHQLTTGRDQSLADLLTGHTRAGEDYSTSSTRLGENHATNLESIGRNYQRLGVSQAGAANQRGVATEGSTLAAAFRARQENQGIDTAAEQRTFDRGTQDLNTAHTREGEDYTTQSGRVSSYYDDPQYGQLALAGQGYQRGVDDRATQAGRVGTEAQQGKLDINDVRNSQAQQAGYVAPGKPSNQFTDANGAYNLVVRGTRRYKVRPDGSEEYAGVHH